MNLKLVLIALTCSTRVSHYSHLASILPNSEPGIHRGSPCDGLASAPVSETTVTIIHGTRERLVL